MLKGCSQSIEEQIAEFAELKEGWWEPEDPGQAYHPEFLARAGEWLNTNIISKELPTPYLFPCPDGATISVQWNDDDTGLEIVSSLDAEEMIFELFAMEIDGPHKPYLKRFNLVDPEENKQVAACLEFVLKGGMKNLVTDLCTACIEKTSETCQGGHAFQPGCLQFDYGSEE